MLLNNKIAVVTGASNGIGRSIVDVFLENGAEVMVWILSRLNRGIVI